MHVARPHCCWAASDRRHLDLLGITPNTSYPGNSCSDLHMPLERASVWVLRRLDLLSMKMHWSYWSFFSLGLVWLTGRLNLGVTACLTVSTKYEASRPWSSLCYSGRLLNSPPKHLRSILNSRKRKGSALCRQELAIPVSLLQKAWQKEGETWQENCLPWLAETKKMVWSRICHLEKVLLVRALEGEARRVLPQINLILAHIRGLLKQLSYKLQASR